MVKYVVVTDIPETWCEAIPDTWIQQTEEGCFAFSPREIRLAIRRQTDVDRGTREKCAVKQKSRFYSKSLNWLLSDTRTYISVKKPYVTKGPKGDLFEDEGNI